MLSQLCRRSSFQDVQLVACYQLPEQAGSHAHSRNTVGSNRTAYPCPVAFVQQISPRTSANTTSHRAALQQCILYGILDITASRCCDRVVALRTDINLAYVLSQKLHTHIIKSFVGWHRPLFFAHSRNSCYISYFSTFTYRVMCNVYPCTSSRTVKFRVSLLVTAHDWCSEVEGAIFEQNESASQRSAKHDLISIRPQTRKLVDHLRSAQTTSSYQ